MITHLHLSTRDQEIMELVRQVRVHALAKESSAYRWDLVTRSTDMELVLALGKAATLDGALTNVWAVRSKLAYSLDKKAKAQGIVKASNIVWIYHDREKLGNPWRATFNDGTPHHVAPTLDSLVDWLATCYPSIIPRVVKYF